MMSGAGSEAPAVILVAEDNEPNRILSLRQLARLGYRAAAVRNGREALAAVARERFVLVLMDCQMPEMDGFEATRAIRERERLGGPRLPIVGVTASATEQDREACAAAGMDDFVTKPVTMEALAAVLDRWLGDGGAEASLERARVDGEAPASAVGAAGAVDLERLGRLREELEEPAFSRFLGAYLGELPGRVDAIKRAGGTADPDGLRRAAHALKSSSAAVGASRLAALCAELEEMGRARSTEGASDLVGLLETESARVADVLTREAGE